MDTPTHTLQSEDYMKIEVTLPALGESVSEGTITRWLKQVGDRVEIDEPLLEVSTDKVDTEIPSPVAGILLEVRADEDATVDVGTVLAVIDDSPGVEDVGDPAPDAPITEDRSAETESQGPTSKSRIIVEPADRRSAVRLPALGESITEGTVLRWLKRVGDTVEVDEPRLEVSTDKVDTEIPSPLSGLLAEILVSEDETVAVGTELALVSNISGSFSPGESRPETALNPPDSRETEKNPPPPSPPHIHTESSRTSKGEVEALSTEAVRPERSASLAPISPRGQIVKLSRLRKVIAERMVQSLQVSAQLTTVVEVDMTAIARHREAMKSDFERREGVKLTFMPYFAKAALEVLKHHASLNAQLDLARGEVLYHDLEHLAIAVDTERGLMTPVIRDAGDLSIPGLASKIASVADRARTNQISPDELTGGTFTITNTGSRGALFDTPILNQPQVAILGTGAIVKRAMVIDDANLGETIAIRHMVYLALTYDHRLVDGADAARYLADLKARLESGTFEV